MMFPANFCLIQILAALGRFALTGGLFFMIHAFCTMANITYILFFYIDSVSYTSL